MFLHPLLKEINILLSFIFDLQDPFPPFHTYYRPSGLLDKLYRSGMISLFLWQFSCPAFLYITNIFSPKKLLKLIIHMILTKMHQVKVTCRLLLWFLKQRCHLLSLMHRSNGSKCNITTVGVLVRFSPLVDNWHKG